MDLIRSGPLWTRARLTRVMKLRYGSSPRGHVNVAAAAADLGVAPRTVQRWLAGSSSRAMANIPPRRLEQLITHLLPSDYARRSETGAAAYAKRAIHNLSLGQGRGVEPGWEKKRWLEPHLVAVLGIKDAGIRQLTVTRSAASSSTDLSKRGRVLDFVVVPTRFHATVLSHEILTALQPWRFQPNPGAVKQGYTQAWLDDAPSTNLTATATQAGLR